MNTPLPGFVSMVSDLSHRFAQTRCLDSRGSSAPVPLSFSLSSDMTQQTAIPLAALLLDYLVAYVPETTEQSLFLSGGLLDLYEGVLYFEDPAIQTHSLFKFSCPSILGHTHAEKLSSFNLLDRLRETFSARLQDSGLKATLKLLHTTEMLDRVAL